MVVRTTVTFMLVVKVTRKYQITIPKSIRKKLGLRIGDELIIKTDGRRIILEPVVRRVRDPLEDMLGLIKSRLNIDAVKLVEESWEED